MEMITVPLTMCSTEIAELTGKRHDHVMRDIRKMLQELGGGPNFGGSYRTAQGKDVACFNLPKRETLILVSGYDVTLRARIIDRWQELETQQQQPQQLALPMGLAEADRRAIIGSVTRNFRSDLDKVVNKLTEQQRHLWRALSKPTNAVHLQGAGFVEVGGVYRLAGLEPGEIPALGKLSNNVSRAMDAFCKRHKVLVTSASVGTREVTHWPKDAAIAWLAENGHNMIRNHLAVHQRPKVVPLSIVPSTEKTD